VLNKIRDLSRVRMNSNLSTGVVGRGRSTRDQIERQHPWLSQLVKPLQRGHSGIYFTK